MWTVILACSRFLEGTWQLLRLWCFYLSTEWDSVIPGKRGRGFWIIPAGQESNLFQLRTGVLMQLETRVLWLYCVLVSGQSHKHWRGSEIWFGLRHDCRIWKRKTTKKKNSSVSDHKQHSVHVTSHPTWFLLSHRTLPGEYQAPARSSEQKSREVSLLLHFSESFIVLFVVKLHSYNLCKIRRKKRKNMINFR